MSIPTKASMPQKPRLLDEVRERIRTLHHSLRTEEGYVNWIKRFIGCGGDSRWSESLQAEPP